MSNFSPAPWHVAEDGLGCKEIRCADGYPIASTDGLFDEAEDQANADLVIAAPDLYDALGLLLSKYKEYTGLQASPLIFCAEAALAKARKGTLTDMTNEQPMAYTQYNIVRFAPNGLIDLLGQLESYGPAICTKIEEPGCWHVLGRLVDLRDYATLDDAAQYIVDTLIADGMTVTVQRWQSDCCVPHARVTTDAERSHPPTFEGQHAYLWAACNAVLGISRGKEDTGTAALEVKQ